MIYELVYTSAPRGLFPGNTGFSVVACTRNIDMVLCRQLEKLSAYTPYYAHYDAKAHLNPVNYAHRVVSVRNVEYHVLSRICFNGLDYTQRSNKLASHIAISSDELSRYPNGPADLFQQRGLFKDESWTIATGYLEQPPCIQPVPPRNKICATWKHFTGDAGWGGVLAETYLNNPGKTIYVVFAPENAAYNLALAMEALELLPPSQRWSVAFSTYFTEVTPGTPCNWRFCTPDSPHLQRAKENPAANFILDLTHPLGNAPNGRLVETARTGIAVEVEKTIIPAEKKETHFKRAVTPKRREAFGVAKVVAAVAVIALIATSLALVLVSRSYIKKIDDLTTKRTNLEVANENYKNLLSSKENDIAKLNKELESEKENIQKNEAEGRTQSEKIAGLEKEKKDLSQKLAAAKDELVKSQNKAQKLNELLNDKNLLSQLKNPSNCNNLEKIVSEVRTSLSEANASKGIKEHQKRMEKVCSDATNAINEIDGVLLVLRFVQSECKKINATDISAISNKIDELENAKTRYENVQEDAGYFARLAENVEKAKVKYVIWKFEGAYHYRKNVFKINEDSQTVEYVLPFLTHEDEDEDKVKIEVIKFPESTVEESKYLERKIKFGKITVKIVDKELFKSEVKQIVVRLPDNSEIVLYEGNKPAEPAPGDGSANKEEKETPPAQSPSSSNPATDEKPSGDEHETKKIKITDLNNILDKLEKDKGLMVKLLDLFCRKANVSSKEPEKYLEVITKKIKIAYIFEYLNDKQYKKVYEGDIKKLSLTKKEKNMTISELLKAWGDPFKALGGDNAK